MIAIVYLHGFRSSPQSRKAQQFVAAVAALPAAQRPLLHVPDLQHDPALAIAEVSAWIECELGASGIANLSFVGSSLGGYYATYLAERYNARAVLINPAVRPYEDLRPYIGTQTNLYTGETFEVTPAHFEQLVALKLPRITCPARYFLLARSGDEVLDWHEAAAYYGGAWQYIAGGGDHGWDDFAPEIPSVLRFAGVRA